MAGSGEMCQCHTLTELQICRSAKHDVVRPPAALTQCALEHPRIAWGLRCRREAGVNHLRSKEHLLDPGRCAASAERSRAAPRHTAGEHNAASRSIPCLPARDSEPQLPPLSPAPPPARAAAGQRPAAVSAVRHWASHLPCSLSFSMCCSLPCYHSCHLAEGCNT